MGWSFQIGRAFGIPIRIHITFLLLLAFIGLSRGVQGAFIGGLTGIVFVCALFACVVLHELGHSIVAIRHGVPVDSITLLPFGGVASVQRIPEEPKQELQIAIAGPLVNVGIFVLIASLLAVVGAGGLMAPPLRDVGQDFGVIGFLRQLMWINLVLAGFNLIPAFPMDGGRILRAFLATQMDYVPATQAAAAVGQAFAFVMGFVGLFYNPWLILIAVFVYMGAGQEEQQVRMRRLLRNVPLSAVLITRFESLPEDESLGDALARAGGGFQHDFPVISEGRLVGIATHGEILRGWHEFGPDRPIREIMREDVCMATADASLQDIYDEVAEGKCAVVAVMSGDQLIGLVTPESVARHLMTVTSHPTLGRLRGAATN